MSTVVGDLLVKLRGDTTQFEKSMTGASARLKAMGTKMQGMGRSLAMGLTLPLAGVGIAATKLASTFDMTLSRIKGLVGESSKDIAIWREEILKMGPSVGKGANELGEALFFVTSAGIKGTAAMETVRVSAMGAAAGLGDTAVVADAVTSAMNAYASSNMSAEMATATLVATVREGKAEASSLAPVLGRIMPVANNLGISFDQVGAAMAAMTRIGFDAATSATSLRATMIQLTKVTPAQEAAAKRLGLDFTNLRKTIREDGLLAGLQEIKEKVGDNETAMTEIFPNVRALSGVLGIMGDNADDTAAIFARMAKTTKEDLAKAFEAAEEQAGFKFQQALVSLQNLLIRIGDDILPRLVPKVEALTAKFMEWAEWWKSANPELKKWILTIGTLAAVLGPVLIVVGALASALGSLVAMFGGIAGAVGSVAGVAGTLGGISGALTITTAGAAALTVGLAALAGGIGWLVGKAIRPWFNEMTGLNKTLDLVANKHQDLVGGLAENRGTYETALGTYQRMQKQLGLVGDEWQIQAEFTKENAMRLSMLTEKVINLARKKSELKMRIREVGEEAKKEAEIMVQNEVDVQEAIDDVAAADAAHMQTLKEKYGVMDKADILGKMKELGHDLVKMKDTVDQTQLAKQFNDPMLSMAKLAKDNQIEVPKIFKDAAAALGDKLAPGMEGLLQLTYNFKNDFIDTGKVIDGIMWSTGETAEKALAGGFADGIKQGIDDGGVHLQDFIKRLESDVVYIPVQPNLEGWNQAVEDAIAGRIPDTTG
jgi:TP901 family phage tail tape measure protein